MRKQSSGGWGAGLLPPQLVSQTAVERVRCKSVRLIDAKCDDRASGLLSRFAHAVIDDAAGEIAALVAPL